MVVHLGVGEQVSRGVSFYTQVAMLVSTYDLLRKQFARRLVVFVANSFFKVLPLRFATTTNSTFFRKTSSPEIFRTFPNLSESF
jgi:hypothetical protein